MKSTIEAAERMTGLSVSMLSSGTNSGNESNEVEPASSPRRFTAQYKLKVLREIAKISPDRCGEYLRKRGLYSSHIHRWRKQAEDGSLAALSSKKPGKKTERDYKSEKISQLEKQVTRLEKELGQARIIIEVQKKLADMLGTQTPKTAKDNR